MFPRAWNVQARPPRETTGTVEACTPPRGAGTLHPPQAVSLGLPSPPVPPPPMSARSLAIAAGALLAAGAAAFLALTGEPAANATSDDTVGIQREIERSPLDATPDAAGLVDVAERETSGRSEVAETSLDAAPKVIAATDSNVEPTTARKVRVQVLPPAGAALDGGLRIVGWSDEELQDDDVDWRSETVQRRFRRRSSGADAIRTFSEAESDDEVRWSVAEAAPGQIIDLDFDGAAKVGRLQLDARFLYLSSAVEIDLESDPGLITLEPSVGGWIVGRISTAGVQVEPDEDGSFGSVSLMGGTMSRSRGGGRGMGWTNRKLSLDGTLGFEFRGVPTGMNLQAIVDIPALAPFTSETVDVVAGVKTDLDLDLVPGGAIEGRVVDPAGQPVAGATVIASAGSGMMWGGSRNRREATSAADGAFRIEGIAAGDIKVTSELEEWRDGAAEESVEVQQASTRTGVVVNMERGAVIAGRVLFPDGKPAPDAEVRLEQPRDGGENARRRGPWGGGPSGPERQTVTTDEQGRFRFTALRSAEGRLAASREIEEAGTFACILGGVTPMEFGKEEPVTLRLAATLSVSGLVTDDTGQPVTEFEVRAAREGYSSNVGAGDGVRQTFESEDGTFELGGAGEGDWRLSIRAEGYDSPDDQTLSVVLPQTGAPLAFRLVRLGTVKGIVLDPNGAPVAGARVKRSDARRGFGGWGGDQGVETDETGAFELPELVAGTQSLVASAADWANSEVSTIEVPAGGEMEGVTLALRRGGRITGVVNDATGAPWQGRRVTFASGGGPIAMFGGEETTTTDSSGSFTFEHVTPGKWTVNASPGEEEMFESFRGGNQEQAFFDLMGQNLSEEVEVTDGEEVYVQLGAEPREPVILSGEILRAGERVEGGTITFAREGADLFAGLERGTVEEDGTYRVELDRPGAYVVSVERGPRRNQFLVDITSPGEMRRDFELPEGGVSGRVTAPEGGAAAGVRVTAEPRVGYSFARFDPRNATTGEDGRYEILDLDPGTYTLRFGDRTFGRGGSGTNAAFGRAVVEDVKVSAKDVTSGLDVRLSGAGRVVGTVVNGDGDPVARATIFVRESSGRPIDSISTVRTDASGKYAYSRVSPGTYVVSTRTDAGASESRSGVTVQDGADTTVDLVIGDAATLVIRTVDEEDEPMRAELSVKDPDGLEVSGLVGTELFRDFSGGLSTTEQRVGPLAAGRYTILATADDGRTVKRRVTVKGTKDVNVRVKFKAPKD